MTPSEVEAFEQLEYHQEAVQLRRWEDAFDKLDGVAVPSFSHYRSLLERLVTR